MRVNQVNLNPFRGKVVRTIKHVPQSLYQPPKKVEMTKQEWLDTFKEPIDRIKAQQARAMELDEFMHSDKITKEVEKLPENIDIQIRHNFIERHFENPTDSSYLCICLADNSSMYEIERTSGRGDDNRKIHSMSHHYVQSEDGTIDKKGSVKWIHGLQNYYNEN